MCAGHIRCTAISTRRTGIAVHFGPAAPSIAIGKQTAIGVAPVDIAGKSPLEIYLSIAPGQPVPERLVEAQARADVARSDRPVPEVAPPAAEQVSGSAAQLFTSGWFETNDCYNSSNWSDRGRVLLLVLLAQQHLEC